MRLRIPNPLATEDVNTDKVGVTDVLVEGGTDDGLTVIEGQAGAAYQAPNASPIVMTRGGSTPGRVGHKAHVAAGAYATPRRQEVNTYHELVPPEGDEPAIEDRRQLETGRHTPPRRPHRPDSLADRFIAGTLALGPVGTISMVVGDDSTATRYRTTFRLIAAAACRVTVALAPSENEARGGIQSGLVMVHDGAVAGAGGTPADTVTMEHSDAVWCNVIAVTGAGPFYLSWWTETVYDALRKPAKD